MFQLKIMNIFVTHVVLKLSNISGGCAINHFTGVFNSVLSKGRVVVTDINVYPSIKFTS